MNTDVLGKRNFFIGQCQWSYIHVTYMMIDTRSYMLTSGINIHYGLNMTAVFSLINT